MCSFNDETCRQTNYIHITLAALFDLVKYVINSEEKTPNSNVTNNKTLLDYSVTKR